MMEDIKLPEEFRRVFKKPFGEVFKGEGLKPAEEVKKRLDRERVIVVGDVTLKNILAVGIMPSLSIVDMKTKRKKGEGAFDITRLGFESDQADSLNVIKVKNPPGTISKSLWENIHEHIEKDGSIILVDGEEDLAVLPCILEADWNSVILYGQPDVGIIFVRVTEETKVDAGTILKMITAHCRGRDMPG